MNNVCRIARAEDVLCHKGGSMSKQEDRMEVRMRLGSKIREYIEICLICGFSGEHDIIDDILDVLFDATEGRIKLKIDEE